MYGTNIYNEAKKKGLIDSDDLENILSLDGDSRYKLKNNLTNMKTKTFVKLVDGINRELAEDYFSKHRMQLLISKYTKLYHFRLKETLLLLSINSVRSLYEGFLWVLSGGDERSVIGKVYRRVVYGNKKHRDKLSSL